MRSSPIPKQNFLNEPTKNKLLHGRTSVFQIVFVLGSKVGRDENLGFGGLGASSIYWTPLPRPLDAADLTEYTTGVCQFQYLGLLAPRSPVDCKAKN